jgi:hypothetical protein
MKVITFDVEDNCKVHTRWKNHEDRIGEKTGGQIA